MLHWYMRVCVRDHSDRDKERIHSYFRLQGLDLQWPWFKSLHDCNMVITHTGLHIVP